MCEYSCEAVTWCSNNIKIVANDEKNYYSCGEMSNLSNYHSS